MLYRIKAESKKYNCITTDETDVKAQAWRRAREFCEHHFFYGFVSEQHQTPVQADIITIFNQDYKVLVRWERDLSTNKLTLTQATLPFDWT